MEEETLRIRCPKGLMNKIDGLVEENEYMNRSDAGRDLIRMGIEEKERRRMRHEQTQESDNGDRITNDKTSARVIGG